MDTRYYNLWREARHLWSFSPKHIYNRSYFSAQSRSSSHPLRSHPQHFLQAPSPLPLSSSSNPQLQFLSRLYHRRRPRPESHRPHSTMDDPCRTVWRWSLIQWQRLGWFSVGWLVFATIGTVLADGIQALGFGRGGVEGHKSYLTGIGFGMGFCPSSSGTIRAKTALVDGTLVTVPDTDSCHRPKRSICSRDHHSRSTDQNEKISRDVIESRGAAWAHTFCHSRKP